MISVFRTVLLCYCWLSIAFASLSEEGSPEPDQSSSDNLVHGEFIHKEISGHELEHIHNAIRSKKETMVAGVFQYIVNKNNVTTSFPGTWLDAGVDARFVFFDTGYLIGGWVGPAFPAKVFLRTAAVQTAKQSSWILCDRQIEYTKFVNFVVNVQNGNLYAQAVQAKYMNTEIGNIALTSAYVNSRFESAYGGAPVAAGDRDAGYGAGRLRFWVTTTTVATYSGNYGTSVMALSAPGTLLTSSASNDARMVILGPTVSLTGSGIGGTMSGSIFLQQIGVSQTSAQSTWIACANVGANTYKMANVVINVISTQVYVQQTVAKYYTFPAGAPATISPTSCNTAWNSGVTYIAGASGYTAISFPFYLVRTDQNFLVGPATISPSTVFPGARLGAAVDARMIYPTTCNMYGLLAATNVPVYKLAGSPYNTMQTTYLACAVDRTGTGAYRLVQMNVQVMNATLYANIPLARVAPLGGLGAGNPTIVDCTAAWAAGTPTTIATVTTATTGLGIGSLVYAIGLPDIPPTAAPTVMPTSARPTFAPSVSPLIYAAPTYKQRSRSMFSAIASPSKIVKTWGNTVHAATFVPVQSQLSSNVASVVASRFGFVALKTDGSWASWGDSNSISTHAPGDASRLFQSGLSSANPIANEDGFAAIQTGTRKILTLGRGNIGGDTTGLAPAFCDAACSVALGAGGFVGVAATLGAFAAWRTDGSVVAWGSPLMGGSIPAPTLALLAANPVKSIVASRESFAALTLTGRVIAWGNQYEGDTTAVAGQLQSNVLLVTAAPGAFIAYKQDSSVVVWGMAGRGGNTASVADQLSSAVNSVSFTDGAMAAMKQDGSVVVWGRPDTGGDASAVASQLTSGISSVVGNGGAFAALNSVGGVVAWGKASWGGSIPSALAPLLASNVKSIVATNRAFAALKYDGSVVAWGDATYGGKIGIGYAFYLASSIHTVCANDVAFSAFSTNGNVIAWGHKLAVPTPGLQFNHYEFNSAANTKCVT